MIIQTTTHYFMVTTPYRPRLADRLRQIGGRYFNGSWSVPKTKKKELTRLSEFFGGTWVSDDDFVYPDWKEVEAGFPVMPDLDIEPPLKPGVALFPYQRQAVAYNLLHRRTINGDDMGLGKTIETLATIALANQLFEQGKISDPVLPALVICPNSMKMTWEDEAKKFTYIRPMVLADEVKFNFINYYKHGLANLFIVNYDSLQKYFVESIQKEKDKPLQLKNIVFRPVISEFNCVCIDESHRVKAFHTKRTKLTKGIAHGKKWIFAMSGTIVVNSPADLVPQLGITEMFQFFSKSKSSFEARYCQGRGSNLKELAYQLRKYCYFRREKREVLSQLPGKVRQIVHVQISNGHEYETARKNLVMYLKQFRDATDEQVRKAMRGEVIVRINILKNIAARGKVESAAAYVEDVLENRQKIGVFCHQHEVVDALGVHFPTAVRITGREKLEERHAAKQAFQTDPEALLILLSLGAGGEGITLTAGSICAFVELGWHPAIHDQAEDRFNRIGQVNSVQCIYFIGSGTIDEDIMNIINEKRFMSMDVMGSGDSASSTEEKTMTELIQRLMNNL